MVTWGVTLLPELLEVMSRCVTMANSESSGESALKVGFEVAKLPFWSSSVE